MATASGHHQVLRNETAVNVAGLLHDQTGATRTYELLLDQVVADGEPIARDVDGVVRLTRLRDAVLARVDAAGIAPVLCVRCLREYDQPFAVDFDEQYRQTVDVRTGIDLGQDEVDDDQISWIDENHELDLREALRQEILVALPMRPDCGPDCPGPESLATGDADDETDVVDDRLAALASLLGDGPGRENG